MITVTLKYGFTLEIERTVPPGTTLATLLRDPVNKSRLGYPENVSGVVDGVTIDMNEPLEDGMVIQLEKQAAAKAA